AELKGSALTDSSISIRDYDASPEIPNTYVPYRNANLLCMAVSWAEVISAGKIYIGAVEIDSSGYPDCRKSFFVAMQKAIDTGSLSGSKIQIETPLIDLSKAEIVKLGYSLNAPFELSWSCYRDNDLACGSCDSCVLRLKAFAGAGIPDPISYQRR
ncbi:MAG: 7-cyano-7-deazaguanine synthase, partial [Candidatus Cloacimonetes bacterium]|nr:7-cyano-7-deazaguanine synthase [Candidatus Cloacimonadota bacterium]